MLDGEKGTSPIAHQAWEVLCIPRQGYFNLFNRLNLLLGLPKSCCQRVSSAVHCTVVLGSKTHWLQQVCIYECSSFMEAVTVMTKLCGSGCYKAIVIAGQ